MATPDMATITPKLMRGLDPGSLIPDNLETKRILTVLDKMIDKLELSSMIPCVIESLDNFADILGPEGTTSLVEHQKLSKEMEYLRAEDPWSSLCLLEQLKGSTRNVLRLLLPNPVVCQVLKRQALVRESPAKVFIKALKEFRNLVLERLLTSPEEEEEKLRFMKAVSLQIKENTETITALEAELAATAQTQEEEADWKDNVIKDLQTSMQDLPQDSKTIIQQMKEEGEKQQKEELQASQARCAGLQQDIQELGAQLNALVLEHRASEMALRKRKCRMEAEIVNWIQKYDTDMGEKEAEYEEIQAAYEEEKAQLSLLMEKRDFLLPEYSQIEEEHRILQEKKEQASRELAIMTRAAICIQAFWRGYLIRSIFKSKLKKKGKGKGKGKKAKK
ncbi:dynein regulatory complex protein 10 [Calypte anna]|uniref:dynein regulatory complex protein 10 n=1 Tax=Calypte anna TaxID=9244 RepID=UPI0011C3E3A3|nr:dynein regulatory complex protein 10 [Calypte anna]